MAEHTPHAEGHDTVTRRAIDIHHRMADRLAERDDAVVAGIAAFTHNIGAGVVGIRRQKTRGRVTVTAFGIGNDMAFRLAVSHGAVVATRARSGN